MKYAIFPALAFVVMVFGIITAMSALVLVKPAHANMQCGLKPLVPYGCSAVCVCSDPYDWSTCSWAIVCN